MDSIYSYIAGQIAFTALECINDHRKQNKTLHFFLSCKCINLHTVCLTFTSSHSAAGFFFQKHFSTFILFASNLWGRFVFVSTNILLVRYLNC